MKEDANTLVLNLPKSCTDEVQPGKTYPLKTCLLHLHLIYGHCRKCRLCCCRVREGGVSGSCASVSCFLTPCATPLRLSFPRNDPLTPELCVRADGFADGARLRRHVCAVRSTAGASAFRARAHWRREVCFGEPFVHPFFHAPVPFVCSKPRTNSGDMPARDQVFRGARLRRRVFAVWSTTGASALRVPARRRPFVCSKPRLRTNACGAKCRWLVE